MEKQISAITKKYSRRMLMKRSIALLCCVMLVFTMNTLKRSADTLERVPMCRMEAHVHSEGCYGDTGELICAIPEHVHTDACFQQRPDAQAATEYFGEDNDAWFDGGDEVMTFDGVDAVVEETEAELTVEDEPEAVEDAFDAEEYEAFAEDVAYVVALDAPRRLSGMLEEVGLAIALADIENVGVVENGEDWEGPVWIERDGEDYIIGAQRDFDTAELAVVTAEDVAIINLIDGVAQPRETEDAAQGEEAPIEDAAQDEEAPIEDAAQTEEAPIEDAAQGEEAPIEDAAQDEEVPTENAAQDEEAPIEDAAQADGETPDEGDAETAPAVEGEAEAHEQSDEEAPEEGEEADDESEAADEADGEETGEEKADEETETDEEAEEKSEEESEEAPEEETEEETEAGEETEEEPDEEAEEESEEEAEEEAEEEPQEESGEEAGEASAFAATIDLSGVVDYPLSLRALVKSAMPEEKPEEVPAEDGDAEEETAEEAPAREQAAEEASAEEEPTEEASAKEAVEAEWQIEYDSELLSIEAAEGDYRVTPIQPFEAARITVDNGVRYALTLINYGVVPEEEAADGAETEETEPAGEEDGEAAEEIAGPAMPAMTFEGRTQHVKVAVSAPEGAFPEGTEMIVADVDDAATLSDIEQTVGEDFVEVKRVHAVDISFRFDGAEIEPLLPVSVVMTVDEIEAQQEAVVVHVDDAGETEIVESQSEAPAGETELTVSVQAAEPVDAAEKTEEAVEEPAAPAEEIEIVAEAPETLETATEEAAVAFEAEAFSVYAVVVTETLETRFIDASGETWNISVGYGQNAGIPSGATLSVREIVDEESEEYLAQTEDALRGRQTVTLARFFDISILDAEGNEVQPAEPVEVVAVLAGDNDDDVRAVHFDADGLRLVDARREDEGVSFDAEGFSVWGVVYTVDFHYTVNGQTFDYSIPGGDCASLRALLPIMNIADDDPETEADELDAFMDAISDVTFSAPELVLVNKVEENTTVGALRAALGVESVYSAALTEADRAAIDEKTLTAPDWALFSLEPFTTEETLTVAMNNGDRFVVAVTDAQIATRVIAADGQAYQITLTFGPEAEIPLDAVLSAREILPEDADYADFLAAARRAVAGQEDAPEAEGIEAQEDEFAGFDDEQHEAVEDEYARFFDIEILNGDEKIEPVAPVSVHIALEDAPQTGDALQVVHFVADGPVALDSETTRTDAAANVRFETDSFSVYGVIVGAPAPTGVNDLDGRACKISRNGNYVTSDIDMNQSSHQFIKTNNADRASVWNFERFAGASSAQYYIYTIVNGQRMYMNLDWFSDTNAHAQLSTTPQEFTVTKNGNIYKLHAHMNGKDYYLNEFQNGTGFAAYAWIGAQQCELALTFITDEMKNVEQYMLVTKYEGEYYIVLNDGTLEKAEKIYGDPIAGDFTTPMTWTWDGSHLFHNSLATGYTGDQRASDYYRRYIDPASATGLTQEYGKYENGTQVDGIPTENPTVLVTVRGNVGVYTNKTVIDRHDAMTSTAFEIAQNANDFKIHKGGQYLGVAQDDDGTLRIVGNQGTGADFWFAEPGRVTGQSYLMMTLDDYPKDGEQYFLVAKQGDDYYIVNVDRSLSAKNVAKDNDRLTFLDPEQPQLWTFTGEDDNSQIYCTINGQRLYLNPYDGVISQNEAHNNPTNKLGIKIDGEGGIRQLRGYNPAYFYLDSNRLLCVTGDKNARNMELHLARLHTVNEMDYLDGWGGYAERNHMVNHIDISIEGKTEVNVPLAYGTYLYRNPRQNDPTADDYYKTYTITKSTDMTLTQKVKITEDDIKQGKVEAFVRRIENGKEYYDYRPDLFTITGYSANEKTEYSTDQVRIEGNFKVADIPPVEDYQKDWDDTRRNRFNNRVYYTVSVNKPVTFQYVDPNRGQIYYYADDGSIQPLEVTMDINFSASFNYWDWYGEGAQHNNECPPIQPPKPNIPAGATDKEKAQIWGEFWAGSQFYKWHGNEAQTPRASLDPTDTGARQLYRKQGNQGWNWDYSFSTDGGYSAYTIDARPCGGIGGYGNSGMDFVLGGDAGDAEANVVALNITKMVVDEKGNPIHLAQPVDNDFRVFYNSNGNPDAVNGKAWRIGDEGAITNPIAGDDAIYNGYMELHTKRIQVGSSGMGLIYDYSVQPGMFYIQEDQEKLARTVEDVKGQTWDYVRTFIETEYVWRDSGDTKDKQHVSQTYTGEAGDTYRSVPEVLGPYSANGKNVDDEGKPLRNGFLVYYVYNVYKPKPINIAVEKKWQIGDDVTGPREDASITVTLGRYKLERRDDFTPGGTLNIVDSFSGIDNGYAASYTVLGPNGYAQTLNYGDSMQLADLWAGEYTVVKEVAAKDNYIIDPLQETRFVTVPSNGTGTAEFSTTHFQYIAANDDIIKVGVAVGYPDGSFRVRRNPYNTKYVLTVPKNSWVNFSYDDFRYSNWGLQDDVKWAIYEWDESNPNDIAWKTTSSTNERPAPHGVLQRVSVGEKDVCILIGFHDESIAPAMNIRLERAQNGMMLAPRPGTRSAGTVEPQSQTDTQGAPVSPIEGMKYVKDTETVGGETVVWARTVVLNNAEGWTQTFKEGGQAIDFDEYDPDGYKYVYYISNVTEQNIPAGTEILFDRNYTTTAIDGVGQEPGKIQYTFNVTNRMPDKTTVYIQKVDKNNTTRLLSGAEFNLVRYTDDTYTNTKGEPRTITVNGSATVENLEIGWYMLIETHCPDGYVKTSADPCFEVRANPTTKEIEVSFIDTDMVSYARDSQTFTVKNEPGARLPSTGGSGTTLYYALGSLLVILAAALLMLRRREEV